MKRSRKIWIGIAVPLLIVAVYISNLGSLPEQARGLRLPNEHEELYRYVAQEADEPALCDKISWTAIGPGGFFTEPSFYRSECYDTIAGRTRNAVLCLKVRRLGAISLISEQTSMWSCMKHAREGFFSGIAVSSSPLSRFFSEMGYNPDTLSIVSIPRYYGMMAKDKNYIERAQAKLAQPGLSQEHVAYLADMIALASEDAQWCERIPPSFSVSKVPMPLRSWCYYTLASNSRNEALCDKIPIRSGEDTRVSWHRNCLFQARSRPSNIRYGGEVPGDVEECRSIMSLLGYPIPRGWNFPVYKTAGADFGFLSALRDQSRNAEARRDFIDRINHLPSFP